MYGMARVISGGSGFIDLGRMVALKLLACRLVGSQSNTLRALVKMQRIDYDVGKLCFDGLQRKCPALEEHMS